MTTDPAPAARRIPNFFASAAAALGLWFGGLVAVTPLLEPTSSLVAIGPETLVMRLQGTGAALMGKSGSMLQLQATRPGHVTKLYSAGAWLVLPAFRGGCGMPPRKLNQSVKRS